MKQSQKGCRGCVAKQFGASTWEVGFVVGSHFASVIDSTGPDDEPEFRLCARHSRMARMMSAKSLAWMLRALRAEPVQSASEEKT